LPRVDVSTYGIILSIYDLRTRAPLDGATAEFRDGDFRQTVSSSPLIQGKYMIPGASDRPGAYSITVTRPGYATWSRDGVEVSVKDCFLRTVAIDVELMPNN
jgi:hypothetical protein